MAAAEVGKRSGDLWTWMERKCLYLLQQKNTKTSLLQIQAFMLRNGLQTNVNLFTKFIATCSSLSASGCGNDPLGGIRYARKVFDFRPERDDTFLCNSMIKAHVGSRQFVESFTLYNDLRRETEFLPDNFTFTSLGKSCGLAMGVREGEQVHGVVAKNGFCSDMYVSTALVDMYAKFEKMGDARKVFDEMAHRSEVSWTALVGGYARCGDMVNARGLFGLMPYKDTAACNAMIDAHVKDGDMDSARSLFNEMTERNVVTWTSLIYGYCKNGDLASARSLFDSMPVKNLFSWNAMIGGYCQNKQPQKALELFHELQVNGALEPDEVTIVSVLPAIADLGALDLGDWVHLYAKRKRLDRAVNICTALVDMYAKCGEITKAREIFEGIVEKEVVTWNAMINGFALNGRGIEALTVFSEMTRRGCRPNGVTMMGVLSACSHCGLVKEGKRWFNAMEKELHIIPEIEHYGCMVDLLGKAGCLHEAEKLMESMPYKANRIILSSFLSACGSSKDIMRAERVTKKAIEMDPSNDGNYIMLRNLYAAEKRWKDADELKQLMHGNGAKKEAGCSIIEVNGVVWEFVAGDRIHPDWKSISSVLKQLSLQMRKVFTSHLMPTKAQLETVSLN
uniref:Uncharacterized protein n=1 Tax=Kalanchoe fedtschenkoi TaxID=63787 RepID=A0A7N0UR34_KALFE